MKVIKNGTVYAQTSNSYQNLTNLPKINNHELLGGAVNNTSTSLEITWTGTQAQYDLLDNHNPQCLYIITDGDAGTTANVSYNTLSNIPKLEGQPITGDKIAEDYNLMSRDEIVEKLSQLRSMKKVAELPATPQPYVQYYVGPDASGFYHVYLYDSDLNQMDLGTAALNLNGYQRVSDATLTTLDKTIVGAINELNAKEVEGGGGVQWIDSVNPYDIEDPDYKKIYARIGYPGTIKYVYAKDEDRYDINQNGITIDAYAKESYDQFLGYVRANDPNFVITDTQPTHTDKYAIYISIPFPYTTYKLMYRTDMPQKSLYLYVCSENASGDPEFHQFYPLVEEYNGTSASNENYKSIAKQERGATSDAIASEMAGDMSQGEMKSYTFTGDLMDCPESVYADTPMLYTIYVYKTYDSYQYRVLAKYIDSNRIASMHDSEPWVYSSAGNVLSDNWM